MAIPCDVKVGDLVTAYCKGYWRVVDIRPLIADRDLPHWGAKKGEVFTYEVDLRLEMKFDLTKPKHKARTNSCNHRYVAKVDIDKLIEEHDKLISSLRELIK